MLLVEKKMSMFGKISQVKKNIPQDCQIDPASLELHSNPTPQDSAGVKQARSVDIFCVFFKIYKIYKSYSHMKKVFLERMIVMLSECMF